MNRHLKLLDAAGTSSSRGATARQPAGTATVQEPDQQQPGEAAARVRGDESGVRTARCPRSCRRTSAVVHGRGCEAGRAVNQYAARCSADRGRRRSRPPGTGRAQITSSRTAVAITSTARGPGRPVLTERTPEAGRNIQVRGSAPVTPRRLGGQVGSLASRDGRPGAAPASEDDRLKCAADTGPPLKMNANRPGRRVRGRGSPASSSPYRRGQRGRPIPEPYHDRGEERRCRELRASAAP